MLQVYTSWRTCSSSASSCSSESPAADICASSETIRHYGRLVQSGSLREDAQQREVVRRLSQLQHTLKNYTNSMYLNPPPQTLNLKDDNSQLPNEKDPQVPSAEDKGGGSAAKVKILLYWHNTIMPADNQIPNPLQYNTHTNKLSPTKYNDHYLERWKSWMILTKQCNINDFESV